ncbi:MAG: nucleotidyltransferase domain-containing protein, partial [Thermodesulfobacteriota bacterium]|nr:nucleotidyltransferase domain-containing protein [Thermodesulfobacteriota bacterium]
QLPAEIKKTIDKYLQLLNRNNIPIKDAILFGSYAKGNYQEWSDIDIALVSDIFVGDRIDDKDKIRSITLSVSSEIDIIPFSPNDFNLQNPFAKEILKTGIRLI